MNEESLDSAVLGGEDATMTTTTTTTMLGWGLGLLALIFTNVYLYFKFARKNPRVKQMMTKFVGPAPWPIVGNTFDVLILPQYILKLHLDMIGKYGRVIGGWLANSPYIVLADAVTVEKVLSSNIHIDKSVDYEVLHNFLGTGLLTANGKKWHSRRKLLTPTFHFKILDDFLEIFNEHAATMVKILEEKADSLNTFDICPFIARCTLDVISETAMGEKLNVQQNRDSDYVTTIRKLADVLIKRMLRPWLRSDFVWKWTHATEEKKLVKFLHDFAESVIRNRKLEAATRPNLLKSYDDDEKGVVSSSLLGKRRLAFLDLLLEVADGGKVLSDLDIREETDTFMFEGQDTTAASIGWTIFLLSHNQGCQAILREELVEIFGDDPHRHITSVDLSRMKYLEYCIKESLRLYPSVPFMARKLKTDLDLGDGRVMPSSATVIIGTHALHRDPSVFPDPEKFSPERFEPLNCVGRNPYAYVPFSAGPRNCVGQKFAMLEEKVILSKIFLNFRASAAERLEDVQILPTGILRPVNGLRVRLTRT